jgi:putative transposase
MPGDRRETSTYFVTAYCTARRKIFAEAQSAELMVSVIRDNHQLGRMAIHAYAVLPDHVHVLLTTTNPEVSLDRAMQFLRGRFSFLRMMSGPVWDRMFRKLPIPDERTFWSYRHTLEQNPVRLRMAVLAEDYPYSSAGDGVWMSPMPIELGHKPIDPTPEIVGATDLPDLETNFRPDGQVE